MQHAEEKDLSEWTAGSAASTDDAPMDDGASDEPDWLADWASKKVAGAQSFSEAQPNNLCDLPPFVWRAAPDAALSRATDWKQKMACLEVRSRVRCDRDLYERAISRARVQCSRPVSKKCDRGRLPRDLSLGIDVTNVDLSRGRRVVTRQTAPNATSCAIITATATMTARRATIVLMTTRILTVL